MEVVIEELDRRMNRDKSRAKTALADYGNKNIKTGFYKR